MPKGHALKINVNGLVLSLRGLLVQDTVVPILGAPVALELDGLSDKLCGQPHSGVPGVRLVDCAGAGDAKAGSVQGGQGEDGLGGGAVGVGARVREDDGVAGEDGLDHGHAGLGELGHRRARRGGGLGGVGGGGFGGGGGLGGGGGGGGHDSSGRGGRSTSCFSHCGEK